MHVLIGWISLYFNFFDHNKEFIEGYNPYITKEEEAELDKEPEKK